MEPYAYLSIARWFTGDREEADIAHVTSVLGVQPEPLRADEKYALSVFFFDTTPPDPAEMSAVEEELERHDISFDFSLERDDFP